MFTESWAVKVINWKTDQEVYAALRPHAGRAVYYPDIREVHTPSISIAQALAYQLADTPFDITLQKRQIPTMVIDEAALDAA